MPKLNLSHLIQADIDRINERAAWTADQYNVWQALLRDDKTDAGIMHALHMSEHKYRKIKAAIGTKIDRISSEN